VDTTRGEMVEAELSRLIEKRASADLAEDPDTKEELWKASVRAYNATKEGEHRAAWCEYHQGLATPATLPAGVVLHVSRPPRLCNGR
jgi:hypothetical protein